MPEELEQRLRDALAGDTASPTDEATERGRRAALVAAPAAPARTRRGWVRPLIIIPFACVLVAGAVAAGLIARTGLIHDHLAASTGVSTGHNRPPMKPSLVLPTGSKAIAVSMRGQTWLVSRAGVRLTGLPSPAVSLSPLANYAAVGLGTSLVALSTDGHVWTLHVHGRVVSTSWAPDGLRIAYIVQGASGDVAHVIYGSGSHDVVVGPVQSVPIAWRADALAFAYISPGGHVVADDLSRARSSELLPPPGCRAAPVRDLAYAPEFDKIAGIAANGAVFVLDQDHPAKDLCVPAAASAIVWVSDQTLALAQGSAWDRLDAAGGDRAPSPWFTAPGAVVAAAPGPRLGQFVFAAAAGRWVQILTLSGGGRRTPRVVGTLRGAGGPIALSWR